MPPTSITCDRCGANTEPFHNSPIDLCAACATGLAEWLHSPKPPDPKMLPPRRERFYLAGDPLTLFFQYVQAVVESDAAMVEECAARLAQLGYKVSVMLPPSQH